MENPTLASHLTVKRTNLIIGRLQMKAPFFVNNHLADALCLPIASFIFFSPASVIARTVPDKVEQDNPV